MYMLMKRNTLNLNQDFFSNFQALVEQVLYSPIAISGFYIGMGFLEGRNWEEVKAELREKFLPTYKVRFLILYSMCIHTCQIYVRTILYFDLF